MHLDPRAGGVVVPAWFKRQPQLVLQVGLNMPVPIPDLRVDEDGMSCTLSFNRSPFFCIVPWSAVFAMVGDDSRGMVWPEDVPPEIATQARGREAEPPAKKPAPPRALTSVKAPEPTLHVAAVKGAKTAKASGSTKDAAKPRATTADAGATKTKKPRGKKSAAGAVAMAPEASPRAAPGRLIQIPAPKATRPAPAQPAPAARTAPKPAPSPAPAPAPSRANADAPSPSPPSPAPPAPTRGPAPSRVGGKPKREIPPYLRVVK